MVLHRNGAMPKADFTSIVWLVGAADWMIGAAIAVVPPLDLAPRRPPPLGVVTVAGAVAVAALVGVAAWFVVPAHITAPVLLFVVLHAVVAIVGATVALAVIFVMLVLLAVGGVAVIAAAATVEAVAVMLMLRLTKSLMVLQLVIPIAEGIEVVVDAPACLWLTVTACTLGPVPIKQTIEMFDHECVPPNLARLWILWIELLGATRRTAALTSCTSALSCLLIVMDGASASVNTIMFLFASSFPVRLLRCWAQELLKIDIFVSVLVNALVASLLFLSMLS